ncbi:MAG TPA: carbonic anhydrase family protein [Cyclobacteriaceae bacterium]|nr:carbonic anhydrase family protein [Cyclobacteriaceae bacterium]
MRTQSKDTQSQLTPAKALEILKEGNERFIRNLKANRNLLQQVNETSSGQFPFATILSCMDSRTSSELIFDQGLGDIFSVRVAGAVLNEDVLGSMEYATRVAGSKVIVVLGHTKCGAVVGACNQVKLGNLNLLLEKIQPAIDSEKFTHTDRTGNNGTFVRNVTENHVHLTIRRIREESEIIRNLEISEHIIIVGGIYDVETGQVHFFNGYNEDGLVAEQADVIKSGHLAV